MKYKKLLLLLFILLALPFTLKLKGQDFGQNQSLFSDIKAHNVGDILTVIISEKNQAYSDIETNTEKRTKSNAKGGPGLGTFSFFPQFSASGENKTIFEGSGDNTRNYSFKARMSVTVTAVKPNGDLVIEGTRVTGISNDKEVITLTGVVRQKDITPENTISSHQIADAQVFYTGKGPASAGTRPGIFTRFLNWLF